MRRSVVFRPFVLLVRLLLLQLLFLVVHRAIFLLWFKPTNLSLLDSGLHQAIYLGLKFDLRLALVTLVPFLLLGRVGPLNIVKRGFSHLFWKSYFFITMLFIQLIYMVDYGHYQYLQTRIQAGILQFLEDWQISFGMIQQTYSLGGAFFVLFLLMFVYMKIVRNCFHIIDGTPYGLLISFRRKFLTWPLVILLGALGIYGKIGYYPLRWSDAFFSPDNFVSTTALNPVLYFIDTFQFKVVTYDEAKVREYYPVLANFLKIPTDQQDPKNLNYTRTITPTSFSASPKAPNANVVIVVVESLAAFKTGTFGNTMNPTPYLDELVKKSYFANHFYVPVQATARSIFGLITGIPDITRVQTSTRNPLIVNQRTVINDLSGYSKHYFLGGSLSWGNIRGLLQHNIKDINIHEEGSYTSPRVDVWGISDYNLFKEANNVFSQEKGPFFAIIQTAGYHRPYTIPEDRGSFKVRKLTSEENANLEALGFDSEEEYNSMRFQDYSLGNFLELAQKESYFDKTLFIILGDHGLPAKSAKNISEGERNYDLENFHVPFLIYAPAFFSPTVDEKFYSELDILPTVAGMVGKSYTNSTFGRDMFDPQYDDASRQSFIYYWYTTPPVYGVLDNEFLYTGGESENRDIYRYRTKPGVSLKNEEVATYLERKDLADAIYYTSQYLMYHNANKNQ